MKVSLLIILIVALTACSNHEIPKESIKEETESKQNVISAIISKDITANSKDLLPTLDDLEIGWEMTFDKAKDKSDWVNEDRQKAESRGFIEGYYRQFQKGTVNLQDMSIMALDISISLYSREGAKEVMKETRENIASGEKRYNETSEKEEYTDKGIWETVNATEETIEKLSLLKDPKVADESIMYSITISNDFIGNVKRYCVEFIQENVWADVCCGSLQSENCLGLVQEQAEFISKNIQDG